MSTQKKKQTPIEKVAALIVDKRKAFYLFYIIAGIFCAIATGWTQVNNDITSYLPDSSETRMGLDLMNDQFITYGTGSIMLENITYERRSRSPRSLRRSTESPPSPLRTTRTATRTAPRCSPSPLTARRTTRSPRTR